MREQPLVVSFYTKDTPYEQEADEFIASCQKYGIEYEVEGIASLGSWDRNCAMKPSFVLKKLKEKKRALLWVDIDGRFLKPLPYFAWHETEFSVRVNEQFPHGHCNRLVTATMYCAYSPAVINLLEEWVSLCEAYFAKVDPMVEIWDQQILQEAIANCSSLRFSALPWKFAKIFDYDGEVLSKDEVIIEQTQASRRLKKEVNKDPMSQERLSLVGEILHLFQILDIRLVIEANDQTIDELGTCLCALGLFAKKATIIGKMADLATLEKFFTIARIYPDSSFICDEEALPKSRYVFHLRAEQHIDEIKLFTWLVSCDWR